MDPRKMPNMWVLLLLLSCLCSQTSIAQKKKKPISTLLTAKWSNTPILLEAAEFLASENKEYLWSFITAIGEVTEQGINMKTDEELYQLIQELSARYLTTTQLDILRFSLSLRTESPKLEMYRHLATDRGVHELDCDIVFDYGGKLSCQLPSLHQSEVSSPTFKTDHLYAGGSKKEDLPLVILYGTIGTDTFHAAHNNLVDLATKGEVSYIFRHLVPEGEGKVRLSGYGVELQIKSSEYKAQDDTKLEGEDGGGDDADDDHQDVEGFLFSKLKDLHPDRQDKLVEMKQHLLDMNNDMAPMKVWQLQDLSLQASERIMNSAPAERLAVMSDLASNFPSHARSLSRTSVSKDMKKEVKKNSDLFQTNMALTNKDAALLINGLYFDMDYTDIFTILNSVREEERILSGLGKLGLDPKQAASLITLDLSSQDTTYGVDIRDSAIHWINDIETDKLYKSWPDSVQEMLRPTFPGMLRSVRKNFFNLVIILDPTVPSSRSILKLAESFYVHRAPVRIGVVFSISTDETVTGYDDAGVALNSAFNYISTNKQAYDALAFVTEMYGDLADDDKLTVAVVKEAFLEAYGSDVKLDDVFGEDSEYDVGRQLAKEFVEKTGLVTLPQALMNGVPMDESKLTEEDFEEQLLTALMKETQVIQRAVYKNNLNDRMDVLDFLMNRENIMPRLNQKVLSSADSPVLNMAGDRLNQLSASSFSQLDKKSKSATMINNLKYLVGKELAKSNKLRMISTWVACDLDTPRGRELARSAVQYVKSSNQMRVAFIHNSKSKEPGLISKAVEAALHHMDPIAAAIFVAKILKEDTAIKLEKGTKKIEDYEIPGVDINKFMEDMEKLSPDIFTVHQMYAEKVIKLEPGESAILNNARLIGPLGEDETLTSNDFELMEKLAMAKYGEKLYQAFQNSLDVHSDEISNTALVTGALLSSRPSSKTRMDVTYKGDKHSVIKLEPKFADRPAFDIVAIVDPISRGAQKLTPVLRVLHQVLNAKVRVFLNPVEKHSDMPLKSYFRVVLEPAVQFSESGALQAGPRAVFHNVPEQPILTQNYHVPDNWLVEPVKSIYDLDNIKLESIDNGVSSEWELGSLLLEGHCFESGTGNPTRGLQLNLGTRTKPNVTDTIVMANLGYFQLKADPGAWFLKLREGRSSMIYEILSHENTDSQDDEEQDLPVLMNSFSSRIVKLKVAKKSDMKNEELVPSDRGSDSSSLWSSIKNTFSGSDTDEEEEEGLNIFCLATGHLYERLLKIMMVSVMKHTKTPVKFWILRNFLSPNLKDFIPEYAERYGFKYEYVEYKWPRWLNQQSEKQRVIWGYKILFLDVLFPLNLKKIIFVDTDQIIRTDLTELRDLDLGGAPYGYTPFCDSNTDMEGFRFWKQGYWRNHLAGRKYHISALYVVDLVKFRQIAAGDRLRGQYQALSQDPNSLSNLDQDLPNNMIHQVPIKSLPQEWLWCETWCATSELKNAKSIDLCNNPLTKEPKLSAARRIVSEWTDYDDEMTKLAQQIAKDKANKSATSDHKVEVEKSGKDEL